MVEVPAFAEHIQILGTMFGLVMYPPASEKDSRWRGVADAFCRLRWAEILEANSDLADEVCAVVPAHLLFPLQRARIQVAKAERVVTSMLGAARVLGPAVLALVQGRAPTSSEGSTPWSLANEIRLELGREQQSKLLYEKTFGRPYRSPYPTAKTMKSAAGNFETRIIGAARPVLHILIALEFALANMQRQRGGRTLLEIFPGAVPDSRVRFDRTLMLEPPELARSILDFAAQLEPAVLQLRAGAPAPDEQVRLRLMPPV